MNDRKRIELIVEAVRYCQRVKMLGMPVSCYAKALREPIHFLWERRSGTKIHSAKYRSKAATGLRFGKGELVYDHAVPFRYLQDELGPVDIHVSQTKAATRATNEAKRSASFS